MANDKTQAAELLLADALAHARESAGLTRSELAAQISVSRSLVAINENAGQFPSVMYVTACDRVLNTGGRLQRLREIAAEGRGSGFLADLLDFEARATSISWYHPILIPGLLQTPQYAASVIGGGVFAGLAEPEVANRVETRMSRQKILDRADPPKIWAVLDEAVLHQVIDSVETMRGQLEHLLALSRSRRHVRVQILPFAEGRHALAEPITIVDVADSGRVAHFDDPGGGRLATDPRTVNICVEWFDVLRSQAASLTDSDRLIEQRVKDL